MCSSHVSVIFFSLPDSCGNKIPDFRPVVSRGEISGGGSLGQVLGILPLTSALVIRHVYLGAILGTLSSEDDFCPTRLIDTRIWNVGTKGSSSKARVD